MASFFLLGLKFFRRYRRCHCILYFLSFLKQLNPQHPVSFFISWIFNETHETSCVAHMNVVAKSESKSSFVPVPTRREIKTIEKVKKENPKKSEMKSTVYHYYGPKRKSRCCPQFSVKNWALTSAIYTLVSFYAHEVLLTRRQEWDVQKGMMLAYDWQAGTHRSDVFVYIYWSEDNLGSRMKEMSVKFNLSLQTKSEFLPQRRGYFVVTLNSPPFCGCAIL